MFDREYIQYVSGVVSVRFISEPVFSVMMCYSYHRSHTLYSTRDVL